jgi:hypothetical protein
VSHEPIGELKAEVDLNILLIFVTEEVFHEFSGWLKAEAK